MFVQQSVLICPVPAFARPWALFLPDTGTGERVGKNITAHTRIET